MNIESHNIFILCFRQLLIKIMPLVGSRESSLFILKLISTKQIDDFTAVFLLSAMPINIRQMSEELLIELEVRV